MRYELVVGAYSPSKIQQVKEAVEIGMKRQYSDDLAQAMREFLQKCVGDMQAIIKVTMESTGRFIVETIKPLTEFIVTIENMFRSQFHTHAKVECHPL